jgi:hypothetical protein
MPNRQRGASAALTAAGLALATWLTACGATPQPSPSPSATGGSPTSSATAAPAPTATPSTGLSAAWPVYHQNTDRTGLSPSTPAVTTLSTAWSANLDGAVWAEPIVVGGNVIVATENDSLYALNPQSGAVVWRDHVGTPVPRSDLLGCGDIFPLGMTGTPAYDPATNSIFVVAEETGPVHVLYDFNALTGAVLWSRDVDIDSSLEYRNAVQQRPALAVANGYVYIGFGGLDGDCSQYVGAVVAVPTSDQGSSLQFMVPTSREGAVWATGGPVIVPGGDILVSTGNGAATGGTWDESDSVLELSPTLKVVGDFAPTRWAEDNARDLDLGSVAPTLLPGGLIFIAGKSGIGYVMRLSALTGVGADVSSAQVCGGAMSFGDTASLGDDLFQPCSNGIEEISVASNGSFSSVWQTSSGANGPPVLGAGDVFSVDTASGTLYALSQTTGAVVAQISVGAVEHFTSPALLGDLALVPTRSGVVAISGV